MFAKYATAVTSGTAVTLGLFYLMNLLIDVQPGALSEPRERFELGWVQVDPPEDPPDTIEPPPSKEYIDPPEPPSSKAPADPDSVIRVVSTSAPPTPVTGYRAPDSLFVDGPLVALVRSQPIYPASAIRQELDGFVIVEFDVLADGTVANARVVESSDSVFEHSALRATMKFRFKPRVVDGVPLGSPGIQNLFRFQMDAE